jgi:tRNA threonylcarbamoyladenosine biosynthesis protein TsaE
VHLKLLDSDTTECLGRAVATALQKTGTACPILFQGPLGSGKTTLVRALVESMPGGDNAEVSSPSFNVYNIYPTRPEIVHYDMYRLEGSPVDSSYYEFLDEGRSVLLVEWAEFIPRAEWPDEWLLFRWLPCDEGRLVEISSSGSSARRCYDELRLLVEQLRQ